jgi:O-antigen/teichoic acid export membrane protein
LNKKIARNTLILYARQIFLMLLNLYSVRLILQVMGVEDYGVYNVVTGVVVGLGFLSGSLSVITQRYIAYEMQSNNHEKLNQVFSLCLLVYFIISIVIILAAGTVGLWLVETYLVIPQVRLEAAVWAFQYAIATFILTILSMPFIALLITHEDMTAYAAISVLEGVLKVIALLLIARLSVDGLIYYGFSLSAAALVVLILYIVIAKFKYPRIKISYTWDKAIFKELMGFTGWTLVGNSASVMRNQGTNILLNIYFGPLANAASAVAFQVYYAILSFAQNFTTATRANVIMSYASCDREKYIRLTFLHTKISFFLILTIFTTLQIELTSVLALWLDEVPKYSQEFIRLLLLSGLLESLSYPLMTLSQATGRIKIYQLVVGGIVLCNIPVSLVLLEAGGSPVSVFWAGAFLSIIAYISRLLIISRQVELPLRKYFTSVLGRLLLGTTAGTVAPVLILLLFSETYYRIPVTIAVSMCSYGIAFYLFGLNPDERADTSVFIKKLLSRLPRL